MSKRKQIQPREAALRQDLARQFLRNRSRENPYATGSEHDYVQDREAVAEWAIDRLVHRDDPIAVLQRSVEFTQAWYGERLERLSQLMREEAPEELQHKFFSVVANGTATMHEPPTYAQQLNRAKWRAEEAERDLNIVRGSLGLPNATVAEMVCKIAEFYQAESTELPMRIQRQRRKGWKAPPNTVSVCRPGPFGNPWTVEWARLSGLLRDGAEAFACVSNYRAWLEYSDEKRAEFAACFGEHEERRKRLMELLPTLRGKNLMCFCRLCDEHKDGRPLGVECDKCEPCHIDPLLEFANR